MLAAGCAYLLWLHATGLGIPCPFRLITGWKCPGCGISTLFLLLAEGDLRGAYAANPFLFVTMPLLLAQIIYTTYLKKCSRPLPPWNQRLLFVYLAALIVFGVMRNILYG